MNLNLMDLLEISLGPQIMRYMKDNEIIEIMANDDGKVFYRSYKKWYCLCF